MYLLRFQVSYDRRHGSASLCDRFYSIRTLSARSIITPANTRSALFFCTFFWRLSAIWPFPGVSLGEVATRGLQAIDPAAFVMPAAVGVGQGIEQKKANHMSRRNAFTLIELLVVIAVIAVLMAILIPALSRAREQGKRAACLNNLKQLALSWNLYADDFDGKIVNGNTARGTPTVNRDTDCWVYWTDSTTATEEQKLQGIRDGLLFRYCPNVKLYKCPTGIRGEFVTYSIPDALNGYYYIPGARDQIKALRTQVRNLSEQIVFLDEGRLSPSSWTIWYDQERWWDQITTRHGEGTNFSFADGHSEHWKWQDRRTVEVARADYTQWQNSGRNGSESTQPGNVDLHRVQRGVFGRLGYAAEECPDGICPVR